MQLKYYKNKNNKHVMSLHPEQIELTDEELLSVQNEALDFTKSNISYDGEEMWDLLYNLRRENLKLQLIISKFKV